MDKTKIKRQIRIEIIKNIVKYKLFGFKNIWDSYMQREALASFPKEYNQLFEEVVSDMLKENIFELDKKGYLRVSKQGQDIAFINESYTVERLENKILTHLRDNSFFTNSVWPRITYQSFCEYKLNVYEKYIFEQTLNKMIDEGVFVCDKDDNLKLTQSGQDKIFNYGR